ncbi:MAG: hypothetical protein AB1656_21010 [Candidatus Omnitrophota bacterium]
MKIKDKISAVLSHRQMPWIMALLAMFLILPSLRVGWQLDDNFHRLILLGKTPPSGVKISPLSLFSFLNGDSVKTHALMDEGYLPWWTLEDIRIRFFRPLTIFTHWLDYRLWPNNAALMHLQSILWYGALIAAAAFFYRRMLGAGWVAGLAAFFYAADKAHGVPAGWLANRNAVLAAFFGLLTLILHDRWRRDGWRPARALAPLSFLLALLSAEFGVGTAAYLFAYAVFIERGRRSDKFLSLLPYGLILTLWLVGYHAFGYGAWGSGYYVDPAREPLEFMKSIGFKAPLLLAGQWLGFPLGPAAVLPTNVVRIAWQISLAASVVMVAALSPLLRHNALARFWGLGMLLSLLPICAVFPNERLFFFVGIGTMGLLSKFIQTLREHPSWFYRRRFWRFFAYGLSGLFLLIHGVLSPMLLPLSSLGSTFVEPFIAKAAESLPNDSNITQQDLILVNPPLVFFAHHLPITLFLQDRPLPHTFRVLAQGSSSLQIKRIGERSLSIRPQDGFMNTVNEILFRSASHPMAVGQKVLMTGMSVEIASLTADGRPVEAIFRFDVPLDEASMRWMQWKNGVYVPFVPPSIGQTITLSPVTLFDR